MNRRAFLSALAAAFVLDPEKLLWQPGAKLISIARPRRIVGYDRVPHIEQRGGAFQAINICGGDLGLGVFSRTTYDFIPIYGA